MLFSASIKQDLFEETLCDKLDNVLCTAETEVDMASRCLSIVSKQPSMFPNRALSAHILFKTRSCSVEDEDVSAGAVCFFFFCDREVVKSGKSFGSRVSGMLCAESIN